MAYTADINIVVRGQAAVNKLQRDLDELGQKIDDIAKRRIGPSTALETFNAQLAEAQKRLTEVAAGTNTEAEAIKNYVTALGNANAATERQNNLIKEEIELRRKQKLALSGIRETTQYGGPIGPGQASSVALSSQLRGRTEQILAERQGRAELNTILQKQFEAEQQLVNSRLDAKAAQVQQVLDKQAAAANESAVQTKKLADRQQEFTERTNAAALAARAQTAEFIRQQRIAKQVADLNASAPAAQLLLPAAAPGAPAMGGGARRRITGPVERLGGARTEDQAAMALRFAQALKEQVRPLSQIDALYAGIAGQAAKLQQIKALPDSAMLNATARGIKQLETAEDRLNNERAESVARLQQIDRLEESRRRRAAKLRDRAAYEAPAGPSPAAVSGNNVMRGRLGGALSSGIIGGGFPLLFGQGAGAAVGGGFGGLAGGLLGGGFGFALSIAGTAIGDVIDQTQTFNRSLAVLNATTKQYGATAQVTADDVNKLSKNLNITKEEALNLLGAFSGFRSAETKNALALLYGKDTNTLQDLAAVKDKADLAQVILKSYNKITIETASQLLNQLKTADAATVELAFQKALLDVEIKKTEEGLRQITIQDRIIAGLASIGSLSGGGPVIDPSIFGQQRVQQFRQQNKPQDILNNALKALQQLRGATRTAEGFRPDKAADKAARDAAKEAERVATVVRNRRASAEFMRLESQLQDKIAIAENNRDVVLAARLRGEQNILNVQYEYAKALAEEKNPVAQAAIVYDGLTKITATRKDTEREINKIYAERQRMVADMLTDLDYEIALKYATTKEERTRIEIERERAKLMKEGITDESTLAAIASRRAELQKTVLGTDLIKQQIGALSDEITALTNVGTIAVTVADSIGNAFSQAFQGIISGTMTTQEALSGFFKSVGDAFIQMASEIIAKQISMIILQTILKALGGGAFGFSGSGPVSGEQAFSGAGIGSQGFSLPSLLPGRAGGGPASAGTPYLVGERGPELFVPNTGGGVMSNSDLRSAMGSSPGFSGSPVLNMSFETTNIAGVEYVSRDQLEAAMAETRRQATRDGAKRGMTMTLDRIQQSPQTRSRIGIR